MVTAPKLMILLRCRPPLGSLADNAVHIQSMTKNRSSERDWKAFRWKGCSVDLAFITPYKDRSKTSTTRAEVKAAQTR